MSETTKTKPTAAKDARLFSLADSTETLGRMSLWTLRRHVTLGHVKITRIGKRIFINSDELNRIYTDGLPSLPSPVKTKATSTKRAGASVSA